MWFGRIVPLFRFPLIEGTGFVSQTGQEERTLPLPLELCVGMNTDTGTALYVTYGINPDIRKKSLDQKSIKWGDDLAGWMVIAPFPPSLFKTDRLMRLDVHLRNRFGAFHKGVTNIVADRGGALLGMEVLGTGDMGSLILLPKGLTENALKEDVRKEDEYVRGVEDRSWHNKDGNSDSTSAPLGWISSLFRFSPGEEPIDWIQDRRVLVRDRQITVPYGAFWHDFNQKIGDNNIERVNPSGNMYRSDYCLLARDMELPVLLALFPSRSLFRVDLDVAAAAGQGSPDLDEEMVGPGSGGEGGVQEKLVGKGMLNGVVRELASRGSNIWHVQNTYRSLNFWGEGEEAKLRGVDSRISIVASVPKERQNDRPEVIAAYLGELKKGLLRLRLNPTEEAQKKLVDAIAATPAAVSGQIGNDLSVWQERIRAIRKDFGSGVEEEISQASIIKLMRRVVDEHAQRILRSIEPSFVKNVDIHGPPLFRCFFSHSARPAYDERDHIDRLKLLLESEVFEVIEGEFSLGMSTEALSRGKIRHCDLFVSFLWPREDFRKEKGEYMPPEWVIHEESFAIGQGIPVYRVREQDVMPPRYEKDRLEFLFTKGNMDTWKSLEHQFRLEVRQLVQQILLGMRSTTLGREKDGGG